MLKEKILLKKTNFYLKLYVVSVGFYLILMHHAKKKRSNFVAACKHLFLRNIYTIEDLPAIGIDTTEKYNKIFVALLNLFPVVEAALKDEIESDEFKRFMEEDLNDMYTHMEEAKEYVDNIPVKENLFIK